MTQTPQEALNLLNPKQRRVLRDLVSGRNVQNLKVSLTGKYGAAVQFDCGTLRHGLFIGPRGKIDDHTSVSNLPF